MSAEPSVIVFDGVCVLCNGWVRFLLARDPVGRFRFATMQSPAGRSLLAQHGLDPDDPSSLLLIEAGKAFTDTQAVRRVLYDVGGFWRLAALAMRLVPRAVGDPLYRMVARNRYRWFGRHEVCMVPTAQARDRFLSE